MGGGAADWLCGSQRFGVSVVIDDKIIFGDEAGCVWALNEADGTNHPGWGTNPIDVGGAVLHSPTYPGYGDYIHVATKTGDVYKININDGTEVLIFSEPDAPEDGFWNGCSYDTREDMIFLASRGDVSPERFKIDTDGNVLWQFEQGDVLYAPPTLARKKVYYGIDDPGGVLIVDKAHGTLEYNFAVDGVGSVPQPVTLTRDNYIFAGDRDGQWSLLRASSFDIIWQRHFNDYVWGTALAYHDLDDKNYAVMSIMADISTGYQYGGIYCWDLDAAPRPMLNILMEEMTVTVPFESGLVPNGGHVDDAFTNWRGCADLNITEPILAYNVDPATAAQNVKPTITQGTSKIAETAKENADRLAGSEYVSFFDDDGTPTKHGLIAGLDVADPDRIGHPKSRINFELAKKQSSDLAAGADLLRTTNIQMSTVNPIPGGTEVSLTWDYDGTGLGRSVDHEFIELVSDDPDYYPEVVGMGYYPGIDVYYVGGCLFETFEFMWFNGYEMWHQEVVFNYGRYADGHGARYGLDWGDGINDEPIYDGSLFLFQEGGTWVANWLFDNFAGNYLPDPAPVSGECGIDYADYVPIGRSVVEDWYSGGGCPPVFGVDYLELLADVSWVSFIDTNEYANASYGTKITQVEISPYDFGHGYGDMKLRHFKIENRNDEALENVLAGMIHDWDPQPNNNCAMAIVPQAGAVVMWDSIDPSIAFGHVVMPAYTSQADGGQVACAAYKMIWAADNWHRVYGSHCNIVDCTFRTDEAFISWIEDTDGVGFDPTDPGTGDKTEVFTWAQFDLPASGEHHLYCAVIGVDAFHNDRNIVEDEVRRIASWANKLAGFARGDVNDDGEVNAIDVALIDALVNGAPVVLFPWDGNGDVNLSGAVDAADVSYLFNYLMGGPAPLGEWRFDFMP